MIKNRNTSAIIEYFYRFDQIVYFTGLFMFNVECMCCTLANAFKSAPQYKLYLQCEQKMM